MFFGRRIVPLRGCVYCSLASGDSTVAWVLCLPVRIRPPSDDAHFVGVVCALCSHNQFMYEPFRKGFVFIRILSQLSILNVTNDI
jgi:hypothetical protein